MTANVFIAGPLVTLVNENWTLIGVTSFGYGCARQGYPGVYARVSFAVLEWVYGIIE